MSMGAEVKINGQPLTSRQVWFLSNAVIAFSRQLQTVQQCRLTEDVATDISLKAGQELHALLSKVPSDAG